jgi:hypothetical protein
VEEPPPEAAEELRVVEVGEVVHGQDDGGAARRHRDPGRVHDVDRAGRPLHGRPPQHVPGLVEQRARQRQVVHRDRGAPLFLRRRAVVGADAQQRHAPGGQERPRQLERRHGRAPRNRVPALLQGVGDAHVDSGG